MDKSNFILGEYNFYCQRCNSKCKSSELKLGVGPDKGLRLCEECWDPDPPALKTHKVPRDNRPVKYTAPRPQTQRHSTKPLTWKTMQYPIWNDPNNILPEDFTWNTIK